MLEDDLAIDFDEDWAEEDATAPKIRLMGKVYTLPPTVPALLVLWVHRVRTGGDRPERKADPAEIEKIVATLIGADGVTEVLAKGIGFDRLGDVLKRCMDLYRRRNAADAEGEATAPTGAAQETTGSTSSSSSGAFSSLTGTASTGEVSVPISAMA